MSVKIKFMNFKESHNHKMYIEILSKMTPEQRLNKCFELTELAKNLFLNGLKKRFPHLSEEEIRKIYLKRISKCHNTNY